MAVLPPAIGPRDEDLQALVGEEFEVNAKCAAQVRSLRKFDERSWFPRGATGEQMVTNFNVSEKMDIMRWAILCAAGFGLDGLDIGARELALRQVHALRQEFCQVVETFRDWARQKTISTRRLPRA